MKVKQISACDVISDLMDEKDVCCMDFGGCDHICEVDVFDLGCCNVREVSRLIAKPENLFFEKVEDNS